MNRMRIRGSSGYSTTVKWAKLSFYCSGPVVRNAERPLNSASANVTSCFRLVNLR